MRTALVDQRSAHDVLLMRPRAAGQASRWDLDAAELLERNEAQRLELTRGRAEKWAAALTALTGLLSAVLVGKAPQNVRALLTPWRVAVSALVAAALAPIFTQRVRP
jgi:hypothetical protein